MYLIYSLKLWLAPLSETNIAADNGWLEKEIVPFGMAHFRGAMLVSGRVMFTKPPFIRNVGGFGGQTNKTTQDWQFQKLMWPTRSNNYPFYHNHGSRKSPQIEKKRILEIHPIFHRTMIMGGRLRGTSLNESPSLPAQKLLTGDETKGCQSTWKHRGRIFGEGKTSSI